MNPSGPVQVTAQEQSQRKTNPRPLQTKYSLVRMASNLRDSTVNKT